MPSLTTITSKRISLEDIYIYFQEDIELHLSDASKASIEKSRSYLDEKLKDSDSTFYGINTGFGSLCDVKISKDQLEQLQHNLIVSHAAGTGDLVPEKIARLILLLKIKNLSFGYSGASQLLIDTMIAFFNRKITPVIYQQGSLGASGDLAPLAHLSLPFLGKGKVWYEGKIHDLKDLPSGVCPDAISLRSKEGLALINGTQFSLAYSVWSLYHAERLMRWANIVAAVSLEAFGCSLDPFDLNLHMIRQHDGQQSVAAEVLNILEGSEIIGQKKRSVQDPYSFRCIPQVHGASLTAIRHVADVVSNEINAVTDNPNIFADEDKIISGGNFHAQPLALVLDYLAIALSELSSISERRSYKLLSGARDLPDYLIATSGLNSGMMIAQYTAASIVSQNKQLCSPSSVDSITSSKGQEDHVSMAANAATKCFKVVENIYSVLAIELMISMQALEFRRPLKSSRKIQSVYESYRKHVAPLEQDRILSDDINTTIAFIKENSF